MSDRCEKMGDPQTIVAAARPGQHVVGWKLTSADRGQLLERFRPRYANAVADHVTLSAKVAACTELPDAVSAEVVGHTDDANGVEALVVAIGGSIDRPGGGTYHVTWSLGPGRTAKESNDVLATQGWIALEEPIAIELLPAILR